MFRALFRKEWRQLRTLRWAGLILTALLPIAFLLGAEVARRGWALAEVKDYSVGTLWGEALVATLALGLWPLFTALMTGHAWCAERQDGTAAFVLARPVPPSVAWLAKLVAVLASVALLFAVGTSFGLTLAAAALPWEKAVQLYAWAWKSPVALACLVPAVAAAASFVRSTLLAAVLGVAAGVVVAYLAFTSGVTFRHAFVEIAGETISAAWTFATFVPLLAAASWRAFTTGEPAGRGRAARAGRALGVGLPAVAALFVTTAWGMVRWNASVRPETGWIEAASPGSSFFVTARTWHLVDARGGAVLRTFLPPVESARWNADGSIAVVASAEGPLGSVRGRPRLRFVRRDGSDGAAPIDLPSTSTWRLDLAWAGSRVVALGPDVGRVSSDGFGWTLFVVDVRTRRIVPIPIDGIWRVAWLDEASEEGTIQLNLANWRWQHDEGRTFDTRRPWEVYRLDVERGALVPEAVPSVGGFPSYRLGLSGSGRYLCVDATPKWRGPKRVVDRRTGAIVTEVSGVRFWMSGDRLVWTEPDGTGVRAFMAPPGGAPQQIGAWPTERVSLEPSPDRRRLLVDAGDVSVWDADSGESFPIPRVGPAAVASVQWAGPSTIAWRGPDYLVLADLDALDRRRVVFGRDPFAENRGAD